ncbi:MAG: redoxin domain-containing protein [Dehalococcoidia bacterium]|nr:redoxin domain-containing protein [Dehalococcoidia bacterium]
MTIAVGQKAPDFTAIDSDNKPFTLSHIKGKNVVLAFYPATFSGVCDKEMCTFRDSMSELNKVNAEVVGISVDPRWSVKEFKTKHNLNFPLVSDWDRKIIKLYGVEWPNFGGMQGYSAATRSIFVLDSTGTVRWSWVTDGQGKEPDYAAIKTALAALK